MKKKLLSIADDIIHDIHKLDSIGMVPEHVIETAIHAAGIRWPTDDDEKMFAIDKLVHALHGVRTAFLKGDPTDAVKESIADLDITNLDRVNLAGCSWTRGSDKYWRPDDANLAEGAQYPFDNDGLMTWFKSRSSAQS